MTSPPRRNDLVNVIQSNTTNAGLWFDRYLVKQKDDTLQPYVEHIEQTGKLKTPHRYTTFFNHWKKSLENMGAHFHEFDVIGRLLPGLGGESVIENGLTFHHTYGVPLIPGSSLKGTTRAYAEQNLEGVWGKTIDENGNPVYGAAFKTLFGDQTQQGIAIFLDALPLPRKWEIHNDVMTVHHSDYYQDKPVAPADWDSPTPIPFPAVSGRFLIALSTQAKKEWVYTAMSILKLALMEQGVGAKSSSGYGRLQKAVPAGYLRGVVKEFGLGSNKSFGHILFENEELFVHKDDLRSGTASLKEGDIVDFKLGQGKNGKRAQDVHFP